MTAEERELLIETARAIAELLQNKAADFGTTNNHADHILKLVDKIKTK